MDKPFGGKVIQTQWVLMKGLCTALSHDKFRAFL
jgi:hypothetical protein